jgi:hypothetical protein
MRSETVNLDGLVFTGQVSDSVSSATAVVAGRSGGIPASTRKVSFSVTYHFSALVHPYQMKRRLAQINTQCE